MPGASRSRMDLSYAEESTYGVIPSANLQTVRITNEDLGFNQDTVQSAEIRSDRQTANISRVRVEAAGPVNFELSYGTFDDWFQGLFYASAWDSGGTVGPLTTISAANSDNSFNDSASGFGSVAVGDWIKVSGFTETANNGYFKVTSAAAAKLIVEGGTLTDESAGDSVTVKYSDNIVNGTTLNSYFIERRYTDVSNTFAQFNGMVVNSMTLTLALGRPIEGVFNFLGADEDSATSTGGTGYTAATTTEVMNTVDHINKILEAGATYGVVSGDITIANNLRARQELGSDSLESIGEGPINVSGNITAYFKNATAYNKFLGFTTSSVAYVLADAAGNAYILDVPSVKYTTGRRSGSQEDIIVPLGFSSFIDATESITVRMARIAA